MKKSSLFLASMFFILLFSTTVSAQEKNFFLGKWDVLVEGTPNGDARMTVEFSEKDGAIMSTIIDPTTNTEVAKVNKIENKKNSITIFFTSQGYEVYLFLEKEKENHDKVVGSMMDMFDASGTRIK